LPIHVVDAARLIALRIRQYVPHRHTFMISSMSPSEGLGLGLEQRLGSTCPLDQAAAYRAALHPAGALVGPVPQRVAFVRYCITRWRNTPSGTNRALCVALCAETILASDGCASIGQCATIRSTPTPLCELPEEDP
jgi:hypothetical protein